MSKTLFKIVSIIACTLLYIGCAHEQEAVQPSPRLDDGYGRASMSFPTGIEATSNIRLDKRFPRRVHSGQAYQYTIDVTNLTQLDLENVNIVETFPSSFQVISTEPAIYDTSGDKVAWALGKLEKGGTRTIIVKGVAKDTSDVPCCTEANFKVPALCLNTTVVDSGLQLAMSAPNQKVLCDAIPLNYTVKNTGQSNLRNVVVQSTLPSSVTTAQGGQTVNIDVGPLGPGETKTVSSDVQAKSAGNFSFSSTAKAYPSLLFQGGDAENANITASSETVATQVVQPQLSIQSTGSTDKQYVGRNVNFDFDVSNTGDANAESTVVTASIPANTSFQSASAGGTAVSGNTVSWDLGALGANQSKSVSMVLSALAAGTAATTAQANAQCARAVTASADRPLVGVAALLLELIDVSDPLEVGQSTQYQIQVTNQGNAMATNVQLTGAFEDMSYVTSGGHTTISHSGRDLTFGGFSLAPKEVASWSVTLKATGVGDHRFRLIMNSDQLTRSVEETESTTVY